MSKIMHGIGVCALAALGLSAQAIPVNQTTATSGMIGLAQGQTAQLNLLNPGVLPPATGVVCPAMVSFVNDQGTVLKSATITVLPGKSTSFSLFGDVD